MTRGGTYALVISLKHWLHLRIGRLDTHNLPPGYYVYVGSALGGLRGRLEHHLKSEKRLHWHIDYLLQHATVAQIWYAVGEDKLECTWNAYWLNFREQRPLYPALALQIAAAIPT